MDFEIDVRGNYAGLINMEEIFQRYPIIEEKSELIMSSYDTETMIDDKIIKPLTVRLKEMIFGVELETDKEKFTDAIKKALKMKIVTNAIKLLLKRGDISFSAALEKVEFAEKDLEDIVQGLYNSISKRIDFEDALSKLITPLPEFYN